MLIMSMALFKPTWINPWLDILQVFCFRGLFVILDDAAYAFNSSSVASGGYYGPTNPPNPPVVPKTDSDESFNSSG